MNKIQAISESANQRFTILLTNGDTFVLTMVYRPLQLGWFMGIQYQNFNVTSIRVTTSLNMLSQFSNLIPFGIGCFTNQGQEPLAQTDFVAGNAFLCVLDEADLAAVESYLGSKV